ncbi:MAG TPA: hypothetical protein PLD59_09440 [Tepidisphaeraceae bacterium]|nr:hypothetical protein [Tepidisphaeraceae bacterium]
MAVAAEAALAAAKVPSAPAFPGAEGFGAGATGGRGGETYQVTNLNDDGPGSLRDAVSKPNRIVVFCISGTINLKSRLTISQRNITIAGQSAPGDGICLRGGQLFISDTENVIVRFLRVRPGDELGVEQDAVTVWGSKDVIIDHCSLSWSTDSLNDVVRESGNVTVQWCILSEPLAESVHKKGSHGYATGWDGRKHGGGSFHHNLIAHAVSRAPRIGYFKTGRGLIDCRNNLVYNSGPAYGGEGDDFNFVNNYFKPGPTFKSDNRAVFELWADDARAYIHGNVIEGRHDVLADNPSAVRYRAGVASDGSKREMPTAEKCLLAEPVDMRSPIRTDTAIEAAKRVARFAGAVAPRRDAVDMRILKDVAEGTGKPINSQSEVGGWPALSSADPPLDSDRDGMPDEWEQASGGVLDANDPADAAMIDLATGYSNLEIYLNELAARALKAL